jgi:hypothetical protein
LGYIVFMDQDNTITKTSNRNYSSMYPLMEGHVRNTRFFSRGLYTIKVFKSHVIMPRRPAVDNGN